MTTRRTGTIRERSPGSYELRYSLGLDAATGKRRTAHVTVRGTRKEAEKELRRLLRSLDTGEHVDPNRLTVRDWLTQWLDIVKTERSPLTYERYVELVQDRLLPAFGNYRLGKLSPAHIQGAYTQWATEGRRDGKSGGLSAKSRLLIHNVLSAALGRAVELQHITRNPAQALRRRLPKDESGEMATLTAEQMQQLLDATRSTPLYWPVLLALATGLRRGELLALRWRNVDLDAGAIRVTENLVPVKRGTLVKSPKGGKVRVVTLPTYAIEELRRLKRDQAETLLMLGVRLSGDSLVCAQPDGRQMHPNVLTSYFGRVVRRLGLAIHFHSLRHTHATQLLLAGVHPKVAQERLGHATIAMTMNIYSHVTDQLRDDAAVKIDDVFRRAR